MWYPKKKITALIEGHSEDFPYENKAKDRATLMTMHYSDPSVPPDHTVHITGHRITVHSTKEKAHKKLTSMGFKPVKKPTATMSWKDPNAVEESINESMKLLSTHKSDNGRHHAKVYKDSEWNEHRVKFYTDGKHHEEADYHTDDKNDAVDTAKSQVKKYQDKE